MHLIHLVLQPVTILVALLAAFLFVGISLYQGSQILFLLFLLETSCSK